MPAPMLALLGRALASQAAEGMLTREAMSVAGGNKAIAGRMLKMKASDDRDKAADQKRRDQEQAQEQARQQRMQQQYHDTGGTAARAINAGTNIINDNYRGVARQMLPSGMAHIMDSFANLVNAIDERGKELAQFHGGLAVAGANASVRQMRADMYEANYAGANYARVTDESSKFNTGLQEAFTPIKDLLAGWVADIMEWLNSHMDEIKEFLIFARDAMIASKVLLTEGFTAVVTAVEATIPFSGVGFDQVVEAIGRIPNDVAKEIKEAHEKDALKKKPIFNDIWASPLLLMPPDQGGRPEAVPPMIPGF